MREAIEIVVADSAETIGAVRELFTEYHAWLGDVVCSTTLGAEIASLPEPYAPPGGRLFLALDTAGAAAGCVGIRQFEGVICEMKRLYVSPAFRGLGLGKRLAEAALGAAVELGYREVRLTTLPKSMPEAGALYPRLGFEPRKPFHDFSGVSEDEEIVFMSRPLG